MVLSDDPAAWVGHGLSGAAIIGSLVGFLPPLAAAIAIVWYLIQIWESQTVQGFLARRRAHKHKHGEKHK